MLLLKNNGIRKMKKYLKYSNLLYWLFKDTDYGHTLCFIDKWHL